jgi:hypothetical protein
MNTEPRAFGHPINNLAVSAKLDPQILKKFNYKPPRTEDKELTAKAKKSKKGEGERSPPFTRSFTAFLFPP